MTNRNNKRSQNEHHSVLQACRNPTLVTPSSAHIILDPHNNHKLSSKFKKIYKLCKGAGHVCNTEPIWKDFETNHLCQIYCKYFVLRKL